MSVRLGLLALLADQPMHGYQLRQEFEARTGGTWPLNIGQVYTTLARLVRDGLVEPGGQDATVQGPAASTDGAPARERDESATEQYVLTAAGQAEVDRWWTTPVARTSPARDELAIKLALAVTVPGVDVVDLVQRQRAESMRALRDFTRLAHTAGSSAAPNDLAWSLVLDHLVFATEAEMRWLDHVEARVAQVARAAQAEPRRALAQPAPPTGSEAREPAPAQRRAGQA